MSGEPVNNNAPTHQSLRQADPNHKICIFGPQYCFPTQFQIILREKFFKLREDCFKITDISGNLFFQVFLKLKFTYFEICTT